MFAGVYDPEFIAANQAERADNCIKGSKAEQVEVLRGQIRDFKQSSGVDKVIVLWTANTERYSQVSGRGHGKQADQGSVEARSLRPTESMRRVIVMHGKHRFPGCLLGVPMRSLHRAGRCVRCSDVTSLT